MLSPILLQEVGTSYKVGWSWSGTINKDHAVLYVPIKGNIGQAELHARAIKAHRLKKKDKKEKVNNNKKKKNKTKINGLYINYMLKLIIIHV